MIGAAPWVKDEVDVLLNKVFHIKKTGKRLGSKKTKYKKPYDWFNVLRGTLSNGKKVQLMIIPQHGRYGARKCGILGTVLSFYATHVMAFIGGTSGGHLYFEPTNQRTSWKLDFTGDSRQPHAEENIPKWEERGWTFVQMEEGSRLRHIVDGKSARIADYEDIYMFALEDVNKSRDKLPNDWDEYFDEKRRALRSYTWLEKDRRI
ncbi:hypothetical protein J3E72DRAFT_380226 [Bipolaris maydis]|nr:hypothetical protein J3E72DRAFT_380226 [Bipolaris maydis]